MPIEVRTAHCKELDKVAQKVTYCKLDIDIRRNEPKIITHTSTANVAKAPSETTSETTSATLQGDTSSVKQIESEPWVGTEITVIIEGNWRSHGRFVSKYFSELAVVTPYAELSLTYIDKRDDDALTSVHGKKNKPLTMNFLRRSDRIPPIPEEVKHHPKSVNNLIVRQLLV